MYTRDLPFAMRSVWVFGRQPTEDVCACDYIDRKFKLKCDLWLMLHSPLSLPLFLFFLRSIWVLCDTQKLNTTIFIALTLYVLHIDHGHNRVQFSLCTHRVCNAVSFASRDVDFQCFASGTLWQPQKQNTNASSDTYTPKCMFILFACVRYLLDKCSRN